MNLSKYKIVPLEGILSHEDGENTFAHAVIPFTCPLNHDVEHFLKHTALQNQKMGLSRTNLVYCPHDEQQILVGYYSLALQVLDLDRITSKSLRKRITGFKRETKLGAAVYLLGQLGKNYHHGSNKLISGKELFLLAIRQILSAHQIVGGRIIVAECKNDDNLKHFYEDTLGFQLIDTADDESMLKYMTMISAYK